MTETFKEILLFLKNPILEKDPNTSLSYRLKKFSQLLVISLITGFAFAIIIGIITTTGLLTIENHAMEDIMDQFSLSFVFLIAVVIAPILEELIFRAPLTLFKKRSSFKVAFYAFTLIFGLVHISNYEMTTQILLFTPILVAPQVFLGAYFGYIRVRFGLIWSIALHASFNGILMSFDFF
ncbi:MAG: CPBP family intramembrane metalloprotease [Flavobacteriaceae bacterium]|nr:CPBP family intramembrane metalloprotease [Flavobacteriaceae bacterium]